LISYWYELAYQLAVLYEMIALHSFHSCVVVTQGNASETMHINNFYGQSY